MRALFIILASSFLLIACERSGIPAPSGTWDLGLGGEEEKLPEDTEKYLESKSKEPSADLQKIAGIFEDYNLVLPNGNRIRVCSAYGCTNKDVYRLSSSLLRTAQGKLDGDEKNGIAKALEAVEAEMGPAVGTKEDRQGGPWWGNGNSGQMNATDEALNTTSILLVFMNYDLLKEHDVLAPEHKNNAMYAVIRDRKTGKKWGIDAGYRQHGGEIKVFDWENDAP